MGSFTYNCPHCAGPAEVAEEHVGGNVICPHCSQEYLATAPEPLPEPPRLQTEPAKVPFFKSSRLKLLDQKLRELTADGDYSAEDARGLFYEATRLGLSQSDLDSLRTAALKSATDSIKRKAQLTGHLTDDDEARLLDIGTTFGAKIELAEEFHVFRNIYLVESKNQLPTPMDPAPFLTEPEELVYHRRVATWAQIRVQRRAGERLEELTPLSTGILYVTNQRLFFDGDTRNTSVKLSSILGFHLCPGGIEIEKATGRSDVFEMPPANARFIQALLNALRR
jgi:hypothetical protein